MNSYQLLINGSHSRIFFTRGILQGEPISPYLYILCANILSAWFLQAQHKGFRRDSVLLKLFYLHHILLLMTHCFLLELRRIL